MSAVEKRHTFPSLKPQQLAILRLISTQLPPKLYDPSGQECDVQFLLDHNIIEPHFLFSDRYRCTEKGAAVLAHYASKPSHGIEDAV